MVELPPPQADRADLFGPDPGRNSAMQPAMIVLRSSLDSRSACFVLSSREGEIGMKAIATSLLAAVAALSVPLHAADPNLIGLARADVNLMGGIQFSEMANSPLVQSALDETKKSSPEVGAFLALMGANPFQYLDEVLITGRLDSASVNNEPKDVVIFARGNFADGAFASILCGAACNGEPYGGHQIFPAKGSGEPRHFVALDGRYGALGELADVREAVDRYAAQTRSVFADSLRRSIKRLSGHHIWVTANGPFSSPTGGGTADTANIASNLASKIEAFGLGVSLGSDVRLALEVASPTEADAKQLFDMVQGFLALMKAGEQKPETAEFLNNLTFVHEGRVLEASLHIPEKEVLKQIREQAAKRRQQAAASPTVTSQEPPPPARPPRRKGGIRIYGLERDPVEFPSTTPAQ